MMKAKSLIAISCLLFLFSISAKADSITPDSFSATLAPGASVTITKTVTVDEGTPTSSKVDVFFLADETGSMGLQIAAVKAAAGSILSSTAALGDVAFGVGGYRDVGDSFVYHQLTGLTTDQATAQTAINSWAASGGGDGPEAQLYALQQVANGTSWRAGSERILVWFGDYEGHDPSNGATEASATTALVSNGIQVHALNVGAARLDITGQATRITAATGGTLYSGVTTANIVTTITDAIGTAVATYSSVGLDLSEVPGGVSASYGGPITGSFDRSVERTFDFDVTFTLDTAGTYDFSIYGAVDGGRVAEEIDHIETVPVPGAFLLGMLGLSVTGIKLRKRA